MRERAVRRECRCPSSVIRCLHYAEQFDILLSEEEDGGDYSVVAINGFRLLGKYNLSLKEANKAFSEAEEVIDVY